MAKIRGMSPKQILEGPYHRVVVPDGDGFFSAEIAEFPGCVAVGGSAVEALSNLEDVAESWLESAIAAGQPIPVPEEILEYSGKLVLRLPKSLHARAAHQASKDGVSLNSYLCTAIAHYSGVSEGARTPANVVNVIAGPMNVIATNVQQHLVVGAYAYNPSSPAIAYRTTSNPLAESRWGHLNG